MEAQQTVALVEAITYNMQRNPIHERELFSHATWRQEYPHIRYKSIPQNDVLVTVCSRMFLCRFHDTRL